MKGIFIPEITAEMFRNGCLEAIEALMAEGEIYDIDYDLKSAQPRKRGKWILINDNRGQHFECDKCGEWRYYQGQNFCSHCGADMREGEKDA